MKLKVKVISLPYIFRFYMLCALLGQYIRLAFTGPLVLWLTNFLNILHVHVHHILRSFIITNFIAKITVCKFYFYTIDFFGDSTPYSFATALGKVSKQNEF